MNEVPLYTLHPTPYTLHPTPYTLHPTPCTYNLHSTPYTLHPSPYTLNPAGVRVGRDGVHGDGAVPGGGALELSQAR